ncbi:MAG: transposase [Polyangiaceae bacterium]|nr:transposase [Polyangiaceae bacterium]
MDDLDSPNPSVWDCKYHVVFIPKYRRKSLFGQLRRELGDVFRTLARQKESTILEGHTQNSLATPVEIGVTEAYLTSKERLSSLGLNGSFATAMQLTSSVAAHHVETQSLRR